MACITASLQGRMTCSKAALRGTALRAAQNGSRTVMVADKAVWLPGSPGAKRTCTRCPVSHPAIAHP